MTTITCDDCGAEEMTQGQFCSKCGNDRRAPYCNFCETRHFAHAKCCAEGLKTKMKHMFAIGVEGGMKRARGQ